jgi:uncharacterized protein
MITEASSSSPRPWFREPWVWLIIALPASAVFGGIITIWIAVESDDGLVQDDYYKYGMEINKILDRDKAAVQYELVANLIISEAQNNIQIRLEGNDKFVSPSSIKLSFLHPTIKGQDQIMVFHTDSGGVYAGALPSLISGDWYLQIEADDWRLLEEIFIE